MVHRIVNILIGGRSIRAYFSYIGPGVPGEQIAAVEQLSERSASVPPVRFSALIVDQIVAIVPCAGQQCVSIERSGLIHFQANSGPAVGR